MRFHPRHIVRHPTDAASSAPSRFSTMARSAAAKVLLTGLTACGGGGGGGNAQTAAPNKDIVTAQSGVALYDAVAGFFRMMNLVGVERLTGQPEQKTTACPGGGNIVSNKLATPAPTSVGSIFTVFTLTANQCRFSTSDGLVYSGTWNAEGDIASTTYSPSGVCPTSTCNAGRITIRTDQARYGYGVATDMTPAMPLDLTSTPTSHTFNVFFSGSPITTGTPVLSVFSGNQQITLPAPSSRLALEASLQIMDPNRGPVGLVVAVRGDRETLTITSPFKATLAISEANVVAPIDLDSNGTVDVTYTIPWKDFLETN